MKHAMTTGDSQNQRHLPIEATHNFRDVGGYPAAGGRVMKWRTLFRSDSLHRLSPASQREVVNLGVRSIIDLRFEQEVRDWPSPFAAPGGLDYRHLPVSLDFIADASVRNIEELYHWMLEECQGRISKILSAMAVSGTFPAVVHCAGGKDRTGILVALLLELAGVARETVVEDYTLTGRYVAELVPEMMANARRAGRDMEVFVGFMECTPQAMESALGHLDQRYGGAEGYVRAIGVGRDAIDTLRAALTEERR